MLLFYGWNANINHYSRIGRFVKDWSLLYCAIASHISAIYIYIYIYIYTLKY